MRQLLIAAMIISVAGIAGFAQAAEDQAIIQIDEMITKANVDKDDSAWKTKLPKPEVAEFSADKTYYAVMKTNKGMVRIKLLPETAPMHVTNMIYLARIGFYDNLVFHRVIQGFMAQGGCPLGTGTGGPGYKFGGEFDPDVKHTRAGLLSMANAGPGTDGSQFFLTFKPTAWLDGKHTIYGEVEGEESMKTLKTLESNGSRSGKTTASLQLEKVTIEVK
jgi:cyclophilin family peptidyl-prolyl cis-trans isomerase